MPPTEPPSAFRLDPLAFPAETNMRFLLLLLAAAGTTFGLADFTVYVVAPYLLIDDASANMVSAISAFAIVALVFVLSHRRAQRAARRLITSEKWTSFPPQNGDTLEQASLDRMHTHVTQLIEHLPDIAAQQPRFYWNATSRDSQMPVGMAFGYRRHLYVCLHEGMHVAFLDASHPEAFHAVLLHELGHIANHDVSRTTFSIELGRTFTQIALVLATITETYLVFHLIRRFFSGKTDHIDLQSLGLVVQTALGAVLVIALIEMIRASILRAREYYADTRSCQWLGRAEPLVALFRQPSAPVSATQTLNSPAVGFALSARHHQPLRTLIRDRLAPLHPSHAQRIDALINPRALFAVDLWTTFIAGLLSGLALNANSLILAVLLRLGSFTNAQLSSSLNPQMSRAAGQVIFILFVLVSALVAILLGDAVHSFFLAPLVGTVGVMIQRAAFVDQSARTGEAPLLPLWRLTLLALLVGTGIVCGGTLTPASGVLSLQNRDWLFAPVFVVVWATVVFAWLLPLRWLAGRAYRSHVGTQPPVFRRRCMAALATLAITPLFLFTMFGQGAATWTDAPAELTTGLLVGWLLSFPFSLLIWGIGALLMWLAGWLASARCPACGNTAGHTTAMTLHCAHCGEALKTWAITPTAVRIPPPPPDLSIPSDTPPPL